MDVVVSAKGHGSTNGRITLYQNDGSPSDGGWTDVNIDSNIDGAICVHVEDIDGDGDLDVLGAADDTGDNLIAWWKNDGTPLGANWNQYNIETSFNEAHSIYSADVDSDGDMDVIAAAGGTEDTIAWWENDGSQSFTKQILDSSFNGAWGVYAIDIDFDGDIDILGAATTADDLTWWENDGSQSFTENTIDGDFNGVRNIYAIDIDTDGAVSYTHLTLPTKA